MKTLIINIKQLVQVEEEPRKWVTGADWQNWVSLTMPTF